MKRIALVFTALVFGLTMFAATASAKRRGCKARYTLGSKTTPFYSLGNVGGFFRNKKKLCLNRATSYAPRYVKSLFTKSTALCGKKYTVYIDTEVDGKKNSRDGRVTVANGGYTCKYSCVCPTGGKLSGRYCLRAYRVKASSCKLPAGVRVYAPYSIIGGYLYTTVVRRIGAKCGWKIY